MNNVFADFINTDFLLAAACCFIFADIIRFILCYKYCRKCFGIKESDNG